MHTKIKVSKNLQNILRYHERKISLGKAQLLYAGNMLRDAADLTQKEKLFHFERLNSLNDRITRKTVHLVLSFHRTDQLDNEKMTTVARDYMKEMGLGHQPYLVYRHYDALHPHAHVVASNIQTDGHKIHLWRRDMYHSLKASRELERKYGLYQAGRDITDEEWARQHPAQKLAHGVTPLKPTINAIIEAVTKGYRYTNLTEFNVLLSAYNLHATRGGEDSVTYRTGGLLFYPLGSWGDKEKIYIKASALRCKPTLKNLEVRFRVNDELREPHRQRLTTAIDWVFHKQHVSQDALRRALLKENIQMVSEQGASGELRNVFYIDRLARTVFDGQALGRAYSAEGIGERCISEESWKEKQQTIQLRQTPRQRLRMGHY